MTRTEFAALPGDQRVDGCITFRHGPDQADIHHGIRNASVRYTLWQYPAFDSIWIGRVIPPRVSPYQPQ